MFTQCPDCATSFRVTAEVLKAAAGKVRCGGCGNAFNALLYLSETRPESPPPKKDEALPELVPDPPEREPGAPPRTISAEQSAALLKTLDQLAGEDIRLEDTGVEWRVMDDSGIHSTNIDELLDDTPTPVDEFLTKTPTEVEAGEIFEDPMESVEAAEVFEPAPEAATHTPAEEMRFDDNTGLPDDFDIDDLPSSPPPPEPEPEPVPEPVTEQVDIAFGDPDEWGELLDEVAQPQDDVEAAEPEAAPAAETPPDIDTQFGLQAEALGISDSTTQLDDELAEARAALSAERAEDTDDADEPADTSIDDDLIAAAFEKEAAAKSDASGETEIDLEDLSDIIVVDAADDDAAGAEDDMPVLDEPDDEEIELELVDADLAEPADRPLEDIAASTTDDFEVRLEDESEPDRETYVPPQTEEEMTVNMMIDQDLMSMAVEDDDGFTSTMVLEAEMAVEKPDKAGKDDGDAEDAAPTPDFKDTSAGFETIIMEGDISEHAEEQKKLLAERRAQETMKNTGFLAAARQKIMGHPQEDSPGGSRRGGMTIGVFVLFVLVFVQVIHQSRTALAKMPVFNNTIGPIYRAFGAPITPDWDVKGWRFEVTKGTTGMPSPDDTDQITPNVEEVDDSEDIFAEEDEVLTIYSRISNQSDEALPYPLISVALIDNVEETIGSKVLEPVSYLTGSLDPRELVPPGNTFNAVISIDAPSPEAAGFRLSVCYRNDGGSLRCAVDNFK